MLRSKYAQPETPTYVELVFPYRGREYTVKRSPEYQRPKKKRDGITTQKAEAELHFPDGRPPLTKLKEVGEEIVKSPSERQAIFSDRDDRAGRFYEIAAGQDTGAKRNLPGNFPHENLYFRSGIFKIPGVRTWK